MHVFRSLFVRLLRSHAIVIADCRHELAFRVSGFRGLLRITEGSFIVFLLVSFPCKRQPGLHLTVFFRCGGHAENDQKQSKNQAEPLFQGLTHRVYHFLLGPLLYD